MGSSVDDEREILIGSIVLKKGSAWKPVLGSIVLKKGSAVY